MPRKSIRLALLATGCIILAGLVACSSGVGKSQIATATVKRGDIIRHVTSDGRLSFVDYRNLNFGTSGKISKISVNEMDKVTKGQELARLDTTDLEQAVKAAGLGVTVAELALKSAETALPQVQDAVKSAGIDLDAATDNFRKITYPYTYSTLTFDVPTALANIIDASQQITAAEAGLQPGLIPDQYAQALANLQKALDSLTKGQQALSRGQGQDVFSSGLLAVKDFWTLRAAQQAMDKAQLALSSAEATFSRAQVAVDQAKSNMDMANNNLNSAKNQLDKAVIVAPFDGVIANVNIKEGDVLSPVNYTMTAINLIDPRHMELDINVNEVDVPTVKLGQKVTISVDAVPNSQFGGVVTSINPWPTTAAESATVSYQVKTVFDVPQDSALKAGMAATADIISDSHTNVLSVPSRSISKDAQGRPIVNVLVNGQSQPTPVVTGISDGQQTEIVQGLSDGQVVIVDRTALSLNGTPR